MQSESALAEQASSKRLGLPSNGPELDLSRFQLYDRRIFRWGLRSDLSFDKTLALSVDGTIYRVDAP